MLVLQKDDTVAAQTSEKTGEQTAVLLQRLAAGCEPVEQRRLLEEVVVLNLPVAHALAWRYRGRGLPLEDLEQVAAVGLVAAAGRFDAARGTSFLAYAVPTMIGEIKRHFRDTAWAVRPPRRLQELHIQVQVVAETLTHDLGRSPTVQELAAALPVDEDTVVDVIASGNAYTAYSLDIPPHGEDGSWADTVVDPDTAMATTVDRVALQQLLMRLPSRERRILGLRFFADRTQTQIAAEVGVSQMHVSRLLNQTLTRLQDQLQARPDTTA